MNALAKAEPRTRTRMAQLGGIAAAVVMAVVATLTMNAQPANAGEALYKKVRIHNHAWYSLHVDMVYKTDDKFIWGTGKGAVSVGETFETEEVVDGDREIEFYFRIEAGKELWYDAGTAKDAADYCFDTWGTTLDPEILRTDCETGAVI